MLIILGIIYLYNPDYFSKPTTLTWIILAGIIVYFITFLSNLQINF